MTKTLLTTSSFAGGRSATMFVACMATVFMVAPSAAAEDAAECRCQSAFFCGADSCDPADDGYCTNSFISFATEPPTINFCIGEDCMSGPATLARPRDVEIWLHGSFGHTAAPDQNPTSVTFLFDRTTGIGMVQASDEQGVDQVSVICDIGDGE